MFGVLFIDATKNVLFQHKSVKFLQNKPRQGIDCNNFSNDDNHINYTNNNLIQIFAPLMLSRGILKSEVKLGISGIKFGKTRLAFSDKFGVTFLAFTKLDSRPILDLFLTKVIEFVTTLFGPDVKNIMVRISNVFMA